VASSDFRTMFPVRGQCRVGAGAPDGQLTSTRFTGVFFIKISVFNLKVVTISASEAIKQIGESMSHPGIKR